MLSVGDLNGNIYKHYSPEDAKKAKAAMPPHNPVLSQLDVGEPPQWVLDYAKKELGEDPATRCQVLEEFRDLIYERGDVTPHRMDDNFLLRFLRARYFNIRHAHRMLINYYAFRENHADFYEKVDLVQLQKIGDRDLITVPPYREQTGRRILLYRFGSWDPNIYSISEIFQATMIILELAIIEHQAQILGGICMFDLGDLTMQQVWHMTPSIAKIIFQIMVTSFPMKVHAVHIVNQPWIFETIFNLFKPLINDEMRGRLHIHSNNMESLHKHIDPTFLPKRYGGIHPDYDYNDWIQWFKQNDTIRWELTSHGYTIDAYVKDTDEEN